MIETSILDSELSPTPERRRKLLPIWIKVFTWIFMVFIVIVPLGLVLGLFGVNFNLSIYGLETIAPLSVTGLSILILFSIKGLVSFGLWTEKNWAINLALFDAVIGIIVCVFVMLILPFIIKNSGYSFTIRLELVALIPYLIKMNKIKVDWENRKRATPVRR